MFVCSFLRYLYCCNANESAFSGLDDYLLTNFITDIEKFDTLKITYEHCTSKE